MKTISDAVDMRERERERDQRALQLNSEPTPTVSLQHGWNPAGCHNGLGKHFLRAFFLFNNICYCIARHNCYQHGNAYVLQPRTDRKHEYCVIMERGTRNNGYSVTGSNKNSIVRIYIIVNNWFSDLEHRTIDLERKYLKWTLSRLSLCTFLDVLMITNSQF